MPTVRYGFAGRLYLYGREGRGLALAGTRTDYTSRRRGKAQKKSSEVGWVAGMYGSSVDDPRFLDAEAASPTTAKGKVGREQLARQGWERWERGGRVDVKQVQERGREA